MIIKTIARTSTKLSRIKALVNYVFDRSKMEDIKRDKKPVMVKQFLRGYNEQSYAEQFKKNDNERQYNYGNKRTVLRHSILSFHNESESFLTDGVLKTIAKEYMKQRCPESMAVAVVHHETKSPHIHIVWSAVTVTGSPTRINKKEYEVFKKRFQAWQIRTYPQLERSVVEHGKKKSCH